MPLKLETWKIYVLIFIVGVLMMITIELWRHIVIVDHGDAAIIEELDRLEADGETPTVNATLMSYFTSANPEDSLAIVTWLESRLSDGNGPYFYFSSLYRSKTESAELFHQALPYFVTGLLVYRADAARCAYPRSIENLLIVEDGFFRPLIVGVKQHEQRAALERIALDWEDKLTNRSPAKWICDRVPDATTDASQFISFTEWLPLRRRVRTEFTHMLDQI